VYSATPVGMGYMSVAGGWCNICRLTRQAQQLHAQVEQTSVVEIRLAASIVPTPQRSSRVLWDQFHSVKYPPAYLPRDNLMVRSDILDWHGDHLLTNYHTLYTFLRGKGVFVEILSSPYTCFNASDYGALIVADPEEEFYPEEISKLQDVRFSKSSCHN
jgi:membrane-bound transcription factor site-1 protease